MRTLMIITLALALAGCETVKGAGRDISSAGQALDNAF